jgi:aspartyl-tRNA(Asn)/glutamyl-tRNA(Gln) amidotransferase subunit A
MKSFAFASIDDLKAKLANQEITSAELVEFYSQRFAKYDQQLGSALEVFSTESVLAKITNQTGALAGIPGLIKDNICQKDRSVTCASKILTGFKATYDATVVEKLKQAGAVLLGRANMDEFAMGSSNEHSAFKKCHNPWNVDCVPGGSSGGSAAAVAAGLVPWALGTDTGGSVRLPAAFCGIVGMKPTYGLVSRYGVVAYASSLDQVGVLARNVTDNAQVLNVIAGHDPKDSTSLNIAKKDYLKTLKDQLPADFTIGVVDNALNAAGLDAEVKQAIEQVVNFYGKNLNVKIKHLSLKTLDYSAAAYFIISRAEAASNLARFDGVRYGMRSKDAKNLYEMYADTRHNGFGDEVRLRIMVGNYVLSEGHAGKYYHSAQKVQQMIRQELVESFKAVDLLIMPSQAMPAFKIGAFDKNKLQMDLQDYFTCFVNLAGLPAISVPCGYSKEGLPIGFQLIGAHLSEETLYRAAYQYEQAHNWQQTYPEKFE